MALKLYPLRRKSLPTLLAATAALVVLFHTHFTPLRAANLSAFDPGNIMSDSVMANKNSMSVQQIQSFLDSKNPCNNTNVHLAQRYPQLRYHIRNGKFVCMAQESFNGESAAQIIWQAAQDYAINPQVLIVLLEKEQGLISDTWPNHIQYRSATGFGCPDTAACDSQYYGLKNQIRHAAKLFRSVLNGGWTNYPVGPNRIQYSPNKACGSTIVTIKNRATSALYRYTPYQPNQAALNAGYGLGDSCSAYGNRNFYALFTDWFGSTSGIVWGAMDKPRWMEIKHSTRKYDLAIQASVDEPLLEKRQIRFTSKAVLNGVTYLRSEWDQDHVYNKGVALASLQEIPFAPIEHPRWMPIICSSANKVAPSTGLVDTTLSFPVGRVAHFTSKITVNNTTYLRTDTDTKADNELGFPIHCIDTAKTTNTLPFDKPRKLYLPAGTPMINIRTQEETVLQKNISLDFGRKFSFNDVLYYQTTQDFQSDRLIGIASSSVEEHVALIPMDKPRSLTLRSNSQKTSLLTSSPVGQPIPAGTTRPFVDKYLLNGRWYLRTKTDYDTNTLLGIPLHLLQ
ncbi:MAG: hypothetical protein Q4B05_03870 [Candidatus Saccharibacteria bacterium]|nr:hypothetical protein [Candidatus Saccharibacteria bacterium]